MAHAEDDTSGEQAVQGRGLHRGQRDVPQRDGEQADSDVQALGPGECGGGAGDAALEEAVLPEPELFQARVVRGTGDGAEPLGGQLGRNTAPRAVTGSFLRFAHEKRGGVSS